MALIDDQGRVFGRVNLIDAAVAVVLLMLIPIAYTAYVLFRTPMPTISAIEPSQVTVAEEMRVKLHGEGLRPLMRAFIGDAPAKAYLYENDQSVDVLFARMKPGRYDFVLLDGVQEVFRVPKGISIVEPPATASARVVVAGVFVGLDARQAAGLAAGQRFPADGTPEVEIVEVARPRPDSRSVTAGEVNVVLPLENLLQVPALVRLKCGFVESTCTIGGSPIETRRIIALQHPAGTLPFLVDYLIPDGPGRAADLTVRFFVNPDSAQIVKAGDRDTSVSNIGPAAQIASLGAMESSSGETGRMLNEGSGASVERRVTERYTVFNAVVRLDLHGSPYGWRYRAQPVRIGGPFTFSGPTYQVTGSVVAIRWTGTAAEGHEPTD